MVTMLNFGQVASDLVIVLVNIPIDINFDLSLILGYVVQIELLVDGFIYTFILLPLEAFQIRSVFNNQDFSLLKKVQ